MSSEISWINNYRLARPVTRTGAAFHCNERLLLLMKPIYEFGTYKWCPPSKMNFWESKSWCPLWGEETKPKSSQLLTLKISLFLRYVQPKAGNSCIQDHTGHDFILIREAAGLISDLHLTQDFSVTTLLQRNCFAPKYMPRKTWSKSSGHYIWSPTSLFN